MGRCGGRRRRAHAQAAAWGGSAEMMVASRGVGGRGLPERGAGCGVTVQHPAHAAARWRPRGTGARERAWACRARLDRLPLRFRGPPRAGMPPDVAHLCRCAGASPASADMPRAAPASRRGRRGLTGVRGHALKRFARHRRRRGLATACGIPMPEPLYDGRVGERGEGGASRRARTCPATLSQICGTNRASPARAGVRCVSASATSRGTSQGSGLPAHVRTCSLRRIADHGDIGDFPRVGTCSLQRIADPGDIGDSPRVGTCSAVDLRHDGGKGNSPPAQTWSGPAGARPAPRRGLLAHGDMLRRRAGQPSRRRRLPARADMLRCGAQERPRRRPTPRARGHAFAALAVAARPAATPPRARTCSLRPRWRSQAGWKFPARGHALGEIDQPEASRAATARGRT